MKPIIIANWKMNLNFKEAFLKADLLDKRNSQAHFILAPPAPYLAYFAEKFSKTIFCAQDVSSISGYGAYTGEVSADIRKYWVINISFLPWKNKNYTENRNYINKYNS